MGLGGLEPPTSPLSGVRSNQLSYKPKTFACFFCTEYREALWVSLHTQGQKLALSKNQLVWALHQLRRSFFKEVIQPQVPLRLPCYDFTPVIGHTVVTAPLSVRLATSGATNSHGVTGGVYKARERIHRDILIRDY